MKRIVIIAVLMLSAAMSYAQTGRKIYMKYSDEKDVSAVYISTAMFRLIGRLPDIDLNGENVNLTPIIKGLSGLYILNSENPDVNGSLHKEVKKMLSGGNFDLLMEAKDNGSKVRMYTLGDEKTVKNFILHSEDEDETTLIFLDGKMNREDLERLIGQAMADEP